MSANRSAFTIAELLCVLTIMGITAAVAVPGLTAYTDHYYQSVCEERLEKAVSQIRSSCVKDRMERETELVSDIVTEAAEDVSENGRELSAEADETGGFLECDDICPVGDNCRFSWKIVPQDGEEPEYADVTVTASCEEHKLNVSETFRVTYAPSQETEGD